MTTGPALRLSEVVRLAAGRGVFRLSGQFTAVGLAIAWDEGAFGQFANAMGLCAWLALLPTAAEKTALKVVPRLRVLRARVAALTLLAAAAPVVALLIALAVSLVAAPHSTATLYLAAAAWSAATGFLMTVSGLHRLRGRPLLDASAFGALTVLVLAGTAATWLLDWSPTTHLLVQLACVCAVAGYSTSGLPAEWVLPGTPARGRVLRAYGRSAGLLGLSEILEVAGASLVYLTLALSGRVTDSGPLYVALLVASMAGAFLLYQMKLHQPAFSARLRGAGGAGGRTSALNRLRAAQLTGLVFAASVAVLVAFPGGRSALSTTDSLVPVLLLGLLVAVEIVVSFLVMHANFVLENTNSAILTSTSTTAVAGIAATAAFAAVLVPWLGAAGGLVTLVLAATVRATVLRHLVLRRHPELRGTPVPTHR